MKLEAGKEMDRCCVIGWLNEVYRHPTVAFNTYSDEQQIEFAHDALVLLKEQEAVKPITEHKLFLCPVCKNTLFREQKFCHECGKHIEWEGRLNEKSRILFYNSI